MWISMTCGFYSVVQRDDDPTSVVVRARVREDLVALRRWVPMLGRICAGKGAGLPVPVLRLEGGVRAGVGGGGDRRADCRNYKKAACE